MPDKKTKHYRNSIRLPNYDYTQAGAYFITLVTNNREYLFGEVDHSQMHLSSIGNVVQEVWKSIPIHFPHATENHFVIMPNHIHGIIIVGARRAVPLPTNIQIFEQFGRPVKGSIPTIIRSFKSEATRRVNILRQTPGGKLWQRNYYEHIIRNEEEFQSVVDYILTNPMNWHDDTYFS
jgi:putative transposase